MTVNQVRAQADAAFELARLYYKSCDFHNAIPTAQKASRFFLDLKDVPYYLKCQNMLLRMYAERDDQTAINQTKEVLQDLVLKEGFELSSSTYYTLGICASYKKQTDLALEYFQKALALSLAADDKEDMCYAINGVALTYFKVGRYQEALKEIYNLRVFFQVLSLPEVKISTEILNGLILKNLGQYDDAIKVFGECFEALKENKNMFMYVQLLYAVGVTYKAAGQLDMARFYLQLCKRTLDPQNLKTVASDLEKVLSELGISQTTSNAYDIIFNSSSKTVVERKRGKIDFKNQFILLDLLHLFMKRPGFVYSKEQITERLWSESYNPSVHDNKIYVTIKRLRQMIEPETESPKYIFRAKNGYYLNKETKVMMDV